MNELEPRAEQFVKLLLEAVFWFRTRETRRDDWDCLKVARAHEHLRRGKQARLPRGVVDAIDSHTREAPRGRHLADLHRMGGEPHGQLRRPVPPFVYDDP